MLVKEGCVVCTRAGFVACGHGRKEVNFKQPGGAPKGWVDTPGRQRLANGLLWFWGKPLVLGIMCGISQIIALEERAAH